MRRTPKRKRHYFFFNDTATTKIYTLSLQRRSTDLIGREADLLRRGGGRQPAVVPERPARSGLRLDHEDPLVLPGLDVDAGDRKSTRLNSSHANISYAVFCLKI